VLMPFELIILWIFLGLISSAVVGPYLWPRRSDDTRAPDSGTGRGYGDDHA
jgi:hypothetical protein